MRSFPAKHLGVTSVSFVLAAGMVCVVGAEAPATQRSTPAIIPLPAKIELREGAFALRANAV